MGLIRIIQDHNRNKELRKMRELEEMKMNLQKQKPVKRKTTKKKTVKRKK